MQHIRQETVGLNAIAFFIAPDKLITKAATLRSLVVSFHNILNGNRLRTVVSTNPIGIRKINSYRRRRITIATQHRDRDHLRTHTFYPFLLESFIYRRMIFKPLSILTDGLRTTSGFFVPEIHRRFPTRLQSQSITIGFDKTIYEINLRVGIFYPKNRIGIEGTKIAGTIIIYQRSDDLALFLVLGKSSGLLQFSYNPFDGFRIQTSYFPNPFD